MSRNRLGTRRALHLRPGPAPTPPPLVPWQTGADGALTQTGGTFSWLCGHTYDYSSVTLNGVNISLDGSTGAPPLIGCLGNFSMVNNTVNGQDNQDITNLYDSGGQPWLTTYSKTTPNGARSFSYDVISGNGGDGGGDAIGTNDPGQGLWGSGGGGCSRVSNGLAGNTGGGGGGGDGSASSGGVAGPVFGNAGGAGTNETLNPSAGGGAGLAISGQNIMFDIFGNVTLSGNNFVLSGSNGAIGGDGGSCVLSAGDNAGGGGGSAGGFGGSAQFFVHGTGIGSITLGQFSLGGGVGGAGGAGGNGPSGAGDGVAGSPGNDGQSGSLVTTSY